MVASARMAAPQVLYIFRFLNIMNIGVKSTDTGSIWVTRNPSSMAFPLVEVDAGAPFCQCLQ